VDTCFVLTPFKELFDTYFTSILKPAIEKSGLYAVRGDSLYRPSSIMDDIWNGIRNSKILVAELTERNPNVFYELGLAHALSKPVILISQGMDDVPFDLRAIRVLLYDKDHPSWGKKLSGALTRALTEVLANPIESIPNTFKTPVHVDRPKESEVLLRLARLERTVERIGISASFSAEDSEPPNEDADKLKPGVKVTHAKFGEGVVLDGEGSGRNRRVTVNFLNQGVKVLLASYLSPAVENDPT